MSLDQEMDGGSISTSLRGVRVVVRGGLNSLFRYLPYQGKSYQEEEPLPEKLKEEFGQLLSQLFQKEGMVLKEIHLRRMDGSRGVSIVLLVVVVHAFAGHEGTQVCYTILKYGRRQQVRSALSEERRWRDYVIHYLDRSNVALIEGMGQTSLLRGILYSYEGVPTGGLGGQIRSIHSLADLFQEYWGEEVYEAIFQQVDQILFPWVKVLSSEDIIEHIHRSCQRRIGRIRAFVKQREEIPGGKLRIVGGPEGYTLLPNPLTLLESVDSLRVPVLRGLCHGDLQPGNILFRGLPFNAGQFDVMDRAYKLCLIDFEKTGDGFPLADWANLEVFIAIKNLPPSERIFMVDSMLCSELPSQWDAIGRGSTRMGSNVLRAVRAIRRVVSMHVEWIVPVARRRQVMAGYYGHMAAIALNQVAARNLTLDEKITALTIASLAVERMLELLGVKF